MSRKLASLSASAILLSGTAIADVPRVSADIAPVHSLVARVMQGVGEPDLIVPAGESPHGFNLRPSAASALQAADVVFWIGHDLTPQLEDAIETLAEDASVTELLDVDDITLLDFREGALFEAHDHDHGDHHDEHGDHDDHDHDEDHAHADEHEEHDHEDHADHDDHDHDDHEEHADHDEHDHKEEHAHADEHEHDDHDHKEHDHEHGDDDHAEHKEHDHDGHDDHDDHDDHAGHDHGEHDPHAWLAPSNASVWLNTIAAQLSAADPENAGAYFANAAAAREEMAALSAEIKAALAPVDGLSFIVFHDAYQYFEHDFDFPASGAISIGDASDPSPARIAEIQGRIRDEGVDCVLAEPQFNPGLVATVLDGTEAGTSVIDPLGASLEPGASLYPQLIRDMATALIGCK